MTPRRVAIPLLPRFKAELERMVQLGVISPVQDPTEWCAGMVVAQKANGSVRICVDLTRLNESVCRERYPLPVVEQVLAQLTGAKLFSKLDANSGFWQIPLSPESALIQHSSHHLGGSVFIGFHSASHQPQNMQKTAEWQVASYSICVLGNDAYGEKIRTN